MADQIVLTAKSRDEKGKQNVGLRTAGHVPAVVYGHGVKPTAVKVPSKEVEKAYLQAGGNKIIGLKVDDNKNRNVLFHDVQHDSRSGAIIHADFYVVRMDEKIKTEVPLHFTGESTAVYQDQGTLFKNLEAIEVEALPGDLPESIEVDISVLDDFEKTIHVSDLTIPSVVELLTDAEELIARVDAPRTAEELEELEEAPVEELPEGVQEEEPVVVKEEQATVK